MALVPLGSPPQAAVASYRRAIGIPDGVRLVGSSAACFMNGGPMRCSRRSPMCRPQHSGKRASAAWRRRTREIRTCRSRASAWPRRARSFARAGPQPGEEFAILELYLTVNVGPTTGVAALEAAMSGLPVIAYQMVADYKSGSSDWIWSSRDIRLSRIASRTWFAIRTKDGAWLRNNKPVPASITRSRRWRRLMTTCIKQPWRPKQKATDADLERRQTGQRRSDLPSGSGQPLWLRDWRWTKIGTFVEIQKGVTVGARCKISSHSFICEGVTIEDGVFVGHGVMFINDMQPRATAADGQLQVEGGWTWSAPSSAPGRRSGPAR